MKYGRVDKLHAMFRDYFRAHGCEWEDTSSVGKGFPDAIVGAGFLQKQTARFINGAVVTSWERVDEPDSGRLALVEIKSGAKAKTKKKTADAQAEFAARFPVWRVATLADADEVITWLKS